MLARLRREVIDRAGVVAAGTGVEDLAGGRRVGPGVGGARQEQAGEQEDRQETPATHECVISRSPRPS